MLEKITALINALLNAAFSGLPGLAGRLDGRHQTLQAEVVRLRQELASALATEAQLSRQFQKHPHSSELSQKLNQETKRRHELKAQLTTVEGELLNAYANKELMKGPDSLLPQGEIKLSCGAVIVLLSFLGVWTAAGLYVLFKQIM